jgi:4-amino-4-deoxy-L-arabinose transferase-like glycosyltransferase
MRLVAVPCFLLTVWLAYLLATTLFPGDDFLALTVPAALAFQPQLSFEGAIVNNDILAILLGALLLYELALTLRDGLTRERAALLGVTQGVALLTKASLLAFAPLIVAVALWRAWPLRRTLAARWRATLPIAGWLVAPAVLLPLPWYLFVRRTYGDFTAFHALDQLQAAWGPPVGSVWAQLTSWSLESARLRESWGEFGWKLMPLSSAEWRAALAATLLCGAGLLVGAARYGWAWRRARRAPGAAWQRAGVVLLLGACLLLYGGVLYFGARFPLTQARYAFPAAPAAALLAMLGLRALLPARGRDQAAACVIALAAAFQVLLLTRLVLPYGLS